MTTFTGLYIKIRDELRNNRTSSPELEARLIAEKASGKTREDYIRDGMSEAPADVISTAERLLRRRLSGEPPAYITGEWEFYSLPFFVTSDTLIPRADSEILAERAIALLQNTSSPHVLDLCAGTGCLGIAVSKNIENVKLTLSDISPGALEICEKNAVRNGVIAEYAVYDVQKTPPNCAKYDMILCNPPYIPSGAISALDSSVRDFEPLTALDGGDDGLRFYRAVASNWKTALRRGGYLLFECGFGQDTDICGIMESEGFSELRITPDLSGIARVIEAKI